MVHFITSESGTVSRRAGLSFSWIAVALVAVGLLAAVPSYAECAPYWECHGAYCDTNCVWADCQVYGGCNMPNKRENFYCNTTELGCYVSTYRCSECD